MTQVKIKRLCPEATVPTYATDGSGCFDLYAADVNGNPDAPIPTGLVFEVPEGHVMLVFSRSGHGFKHNTRLANCVGVIDSDYRGELMVKLHRDSGSGEMLTVRSGDRIAQAMVVPIPRVQFQEVAEVSSTVRGTGGFGSTGG